MLFHVLSLYPTVFHHRRMPASAQVRVHFGPLTVGVLGKARVVFGSRFTITPSLFCGLAWATFHPRQDDLEHHRSVHRGTSIQGFSDWTAPGPFCTAPRGQQQGALRRACPWGCLDDDFAAIDPQLPLPQAPQPQQRQRSRRPIGQRHQRNGRWRRRPPLRPQRPTLLEYRPDIGGCIWTQGTRMPSWSQHRLQRTSPKGCPRTRPPFKGGSHVRGLGFRGLPWGVRGLDQDFHAECPW